MNEKQTKITTKYDLLAYNIETLSISKPIHEAKKLTASETMNLLHLIHNRGLWDDANHIRIHMDYEIDPFCILEKEKNGKWFDATPKEFKSPFSEMQ